MYVDCRWESVWVVLTLFWLEKNTFLAFVVVEEEEYTVCTRLGESLSHEGREGAIHVRDNVKTIFAAIHLSLPSVAELTCSRRKRRSSRGRPWKHET